MMRHIGAVRASVCRSPILIQHNPERGTLGGVRKPVPEGIVETPGERKGSRSILPARGLRIQFIRPLEFFR
jgi:hypothetical protein